IGSDGGQRSSEMESQTCRGPRTVRGCLFQPGSIGRSTARVSNGAHAQLSTVPVTVESGPNKTSYGSDAKAQEAAKAAISIDPSLASLLENHGRAADLPLIVARHRPTRTRLLLRCFFSAGRRDENSLKKTWHRR